MGVVVRKAVAAGASGPGGAERDARERMPGGPMARNSLALGASLCGLEWDAPEMRGTASHSPRVVSRIFSASMAAVWKRGGSWDLRRDRWAIMWSKRETAVSLGWAGSEQ